MGSAASFDLTLNRFGVTLCAMKALLSSLGLAGFTALLCGCAASGSSGCNITSVLEVTPSSATADHSAAAPGNEERFVATERSTSIPGCPVPAVAAITIVPVIYPAWTSSDPVDVTVSSAPDATNGLATCVNATLTPVTLTATEGSGVTAQLASATLTCN